MALNSENNGFAKEKKGFFAAALEDILLLARNNKALIIFALLIPVAIAPLASKWRAYRIHLDQQILYRDPDLTIIEGEGLESSNAAYWINDRELCFAKKYVAFYGPNLPEDGYLSFKYAVPVKKAGRYKVFLAGSPPGSKQSGLDTYFCPFEVYLDGKRMKKITEEHNRSSLIEETGSDFYATYEYALVFRVTKLGEFYLELGDHELEFRIYDKPVGDEEYKFYTDAIFLVPVDWKPKKSLFSLADDIVSH